MLEGMGNIFLPSCSKMVLDESVGERKVFYRLGESEFFQQANKNITINGIKLIDVIPRMVVSDQGFTQVTMSMLDKNTKYELFESGRFKLSCKSTMFKMIDSGKVVMVYSDQFRIPTAIPYIVQMNGRDATIYVNISDYVDMNQYALYEINQARNYNAMMAALFAACVSYRIITMTTTLPADLADGMVLLYATMMEKVINSLVHMDPVMRDKIKYLATEFALIQMYGTEIGTKVFYRYKQTYYPKLSKMITDSIDNQFKLDHFDKFSLWIQELRNNYPSMKGIDVYRVYDKWVRSYGAATSLSIDYLGYQIYTICMILMESPLVTRITLEPMLEKNRGADMYKRMQALIS